jgi:hypothetical protein
MPKQNSIYRRLTGRRRTPFSYSQLWLAPDHILLVKSSRFAEQYQRFALADIQAIVITGLPDRIVLQVAGAGAAILWTLVLLTVTSTFAKGFFVATGAMALGVVLIDVARGPRCRCHLHTAVSRELLSPVSRVRTARKFLATLRPAIEAIQGRLEAERISEVIPAAAGMSEQPPEVPDAPGYLPEVLFGLFLLNAAVVLIDWRFPRSEATNILPTTISAEVIILIVALARRGSRDPRRVIYVLMVVAIFFVGWDAFGMARNLTNWFGILMEAGRRGRPVTSPVTSMTSALTLFSQGNALFAAGWRMAVGAAGLVAAWMERPAETTR